MKLLIMQIPPDSRYFVPLGPKELFAECILINTILSFHEY
jgi:hypothetical protein